MKLKSPFATILILLLLNQNVVAKEYYVHPLKGNDNNSGTSKKNAFKTLQQLSKLTFKPGDKILLAAGQTFESSLDLINQKGSKNQPIILTSINWENADSTKTATINFKNFPNGILIEDCSFITLSNIILTGNGYIEKNNNHTMRCGILITTKSKKVNEFIVIKNIQIKDVFYENAGFIRGKEEVKTANGSQKYGWGIRLINENQKSLMNNIVIENCSINNVSHTGIKLSGTNKNIKKIKIVENKVSNTGGPGIQMSEVSSVYVAKNTVLKSGSNDDSRKWGRGSGLWTWGASDVLIEKNKFLHANGPGDSAGAHIDYNCDNIVIQYNISAFNAGGFCEILGNNYNCIYRYNISINDGHRIKGVNGAFQEGKVFWLSGYQGNKETKGPVNSYFYNNTIYSDESIEAKFAIDKTSKGIVIANNIFCIKGKSKIVLGDQNKRDTQNETQMENVYLKNNLFLNESTWPKEFKMNLENSIFGDPNYINSGGLEIENYIPKALSLYKRKGIEIPTLPACAVKLLFELKIKKDILGAKISGKPSIGAVQ